MRKLIRILAMMAVVGSFAFVATPPASATHFGTDGASPATNHETSPAPAVVTPAVPCVVVGEVLPGASGGAPHYPLDNSALPAIPGDVASHTHYTFVDSLIGCSDIDGVIVGVDADGGNDGHIECLATSSTPCLNLTHSTTGVDARHHGSTNESGWSNCSGYSEGCSDTSASNGCASNANANKGDIATGDGSAGWVKYLRVGVVLYVWGCFDEPGSAAVAANPYFSAVLAIFPPSVLNGGFNNLPFCLIPDNPVTGTPPSCGFSIAGVALRGPSFAIGG